MFLEFKTIYTESEAPKHLKEIINIDSIDRIFINTAGDDNDNNGDYYVWVDIRNGNTIPIHVGNINDCVDFYNSLKRKLDYGVSQTDG